MKKSLILLIIPICLIIFSACNLNNTDNKSVQNNLASNINNFELKTSNEISNGAYNFLIDSSTIAWQSSKVNGSKHTGKVSVKNGSLELKDGKLIGGSLILDMNTITNDENIESLLKHLKGKDFFDTENFDEASLIITKIENQTDNQSYQVEANLTIKDITAPVNFDLLLTNSDNKIIITSNMKIDRTVWDIKYGSGKFFENLGDKVIKDDILFDIYLEAIKK